MLIWLFLAPVFLLVLGVPFLICIGSVVSLFKKPQSVESVEIGPRGSFNQSIEEP